MALAAHDFQALTDGLFLFFFERAQVFDIASELASFAELQRRLPPLFDRVFADRLAPRTILVVPGLSLDEELLARVEGVTHYEERQLTMLMLLKMPNTRMVFLTSAPLDPSIVDYYLQLLPGIPHEHARRRLTLLAAHDTGKEWT